MECALTWQRALHREVKELNKNVFTQKRGALKINQFIIHEEKCPAQQKRLYGTERFIILQLFCTVTVFILTLQTRRGLRKSPQ